MKFVKIICLLYVFLLSTAHAQQLEIKLFQADAYQHILNTYKEEPFMLVIWSVTCSACLSEMALIQKIHQQNPELNIVMLSVDGPEYFADMREIFEKEKLDDVEQWGFAEDNSPALRYSIDSHWYGELPRTYFLDKAHQRNGFSGVLTAEQYKLHIEKMKFKN
jgi:thiol-disulfide isomerase/thioredoxin